MRMALLMTYLWPGFFQLWLRGRWQGVLPASVFAVLLNIALTATWIWPELLNERVVFASWVGVGCVWVVSILRVRREIPAFLADNSAKESMPGLFIRAQTEYLRGNWFEAESLFQHLVDAGDDVEASLMLATLYRRTGKLDEARRALRLLAQSPKASAWRFEIQQELELIERTAKIAADNGSSSKPFEPRESRMPEAA